MTVVRTPQQNSIVEHMNRTLLNMSRCLLIQSRLPLIFWAEVVATLRVIRNRCPSSSLNGDIPRYERWTGKETNWKYLRVFGSTVYILDKNPLNGKLAERSIKGVFVGYPRETKGIEYGCLKIKSSGMSSFKKELHQDRQMMVTKYH